MPEYHTLQSDHEDIAIFILKHPSYKKLQEVQADDSSQFSPEETPLILAAQYNRYEIVMQLLQVQSYHCYKYNRYEIVMELLQVQSYHCHKSRTFLQSI